MSERDADVLVEDMRESIAKILTYTADLTEASFTRNDLVVDAVLRNIEVIGEAASKLPASFRDAHPEIAWRQLIGMRNRLIHAYFGVSLGIVWQTIQKAIPQLSSSLKQL